MMDLSALDKVKIKEIEDEVNYSNCTKCSRLKTFRKEDSGLKSDVCYCTAWDEFSIDDKLSGDLIGDEACVDYKED